MLCCQNAGTCCLNVAISGFSPLKIWQIWVIFSQRKPLKNSQCEKKKKKKKKTNKQKNKKKKKPV
jgi:hypothetical protein